MRDCTKESRKAALHRHKGSERNSSGFLALIVLDSISVTHCPAISPALGNFPFLHFAGLCPGGSNATSKYRNYFSLPSLTAFWESSSCSVVKASERKKDPIFHMHPELIKMQQLQ